MNPELLRNAWLEVSPRRLLLATLVVTLALIAAYYVGEAGEVRAGPKGVFAAAASFSWLVLVVWGARNAVEGVLGEMKDRTWDAQRVSGMSALELTLGKIVGPVLLVWFCGGLCLAAMVWGGHVALAQAGLDARPDAVDGALGDIRPWRMALTMALGGLLAQTCALAAAIFLARGSGGRIGGGASAAAMFVGLFAWAIVWAGDVWLSWTLDGAGARQGESLTWWGLPLGDGRGLVLASYVAFASWSVLGVWRLMRRELQMRSVPWAFPAFAAFLAIYVAGFYWQAGTGFGEASGPVAAAVAGYAALHALTILAAFLEPKDPIALRRLRAAALKHDLSQAAALAPTFAIGGVMAAAAAFAVLAATVLAVASGDARAADGDALMVTLAALGFLVRDAAVITAFGLRPEQRGGVAALFVLGLLYAGFGGAARTFFGEAGGAVFAPAPVVWSALSGWVQASAALALLRNRWRVRVVGALEAAPPPRAPTALVHSE